jgi:uncharacterized membrane protein
MIEMPMFAKKKVGFLKTMENSPLPCYCVTMINRRITMKKHTRWITIIAIGLMLICMAVYVLTLDDSQPMPSPQGTTTAPK